MIPCTAITLASLAFGTRDSRVPFLALSLFRFASSSVPVPSPESRVPSFAEGLDLNVHSDGQFELHQCVDRLGGGLQDVQQPLVRPHLELLPRLLVDVRRAIDRVA